MSYNTVTRSLMNGTSAAQKLEPANHSAFIDIDKQYRETNNSPIIEGQ
jgi:hypothetical protein